MEGDDKDFKIWSAIKLRNGSSQISSELGELLQLLHQSLMLCCRVSVPVIWHTGMMIRLLRIIESLLDILRSIGRLKWRKWLARKCTGQNWLRCRNRSLNSRSGILLHRYTHRLRWHSRRRQGENWTLENSRRLWLGLGSLRRFILHPRLLRDGWQGSYGIGSTHSGRRCVRL